MTKPITDTRSLLGFWQLMGISLGTIIGAGVVILVGVGIDLTGYGTPWAFILALFIVLIPSLCIAALGAAIPASGGMYTYVRDLIGIKAGFLYLSLLVAGQLVLANYAIGFSEYLASVVSGLNTKAVAVAVMTLCYVANLFGVKSAAKLQLVMVSTLILALLLFIVIGLQNVDSFTQYSRYQDIAPNGISSFIAAAFVLRFGMIGSEFISELGGETKKPGTTIPMVMICSLLVATILYVLIAIVATGVLPLDQSQNQTLAFVAKKIFHPAAYIVFIVGGVMLALLSSLNSVFSWCTKGLVVAINDGWLPKSLGASNRFGTAYYLLTLFYIVGMLPILTGMTLQYIAILGNSLGIIFGIMPVLALRNLYSRNPQAYRDATFKIPIAAMKILPLFGFMIYGFGVYLSFDFIGVYGIAVIILYVALVLLYVNYRAPVVMALAKDKRTGRSAVSIP